MDGLPKTPLAVVLAICLLPASVSAEMYGLSPEEMRSVQELQRRWNSLDARDRAGIDLPEPDEIIRQMLDGRGKKCYSTFHRGMMPCEMARSTPGYPGRSVPNLGSSMLDGSVNIPEPQLGVRSPAYRNLAAQISDQFDRYDGDYEQTRAFLMSFDFEPWVADAVDRSPCASDHDYPACDLYPEFFNCDFEDWCIAYWANESEDAYLSIVLQGGTGRWFPHRPSIMPRDTAEWSQTAIAEESAARRE